MARPTLPFEQLVFGGGGIRCFWHGGFCEVVEERYALKPERIACVSGGALSAACWIGGREDKLRRVMGEAFDECDSNVDVDSNNRTPHEEMYRRVVERTLDEEALNSIREGPQFEVVLACAADPVPTMLHGFFGMIAYQLDEHIRSNPHMKWPKAIGLTPKRCDARRAAREGKLIDLICAAATIPPVFDIPNWDRTQVLDGGMMDKAPMPEPDEGDTLILLTRRYRNPPRIPGRSYRMPSKEVAADKIDFTDRTKIDRTWEQGRKDAKTWLEQLDAA